MAQHHVVVIDDDLSECEFLQHALHEADVEALTLTESRQAIEILLKTKPCSALKSRAYGLWLRHSYVLHGSHVHHIRVHSRYHWSDLLLAP